jgi:hypothetical protein
VSVSCIRFGVGNREQRVERLRRYSEALGERGAAQTLRFEIERELIRGRELTRVSTGRHCDQGTGGAERRLA